ATCCCRLWPLRLNRPPAEDVTRSAAQNNLWRYDMDKQPIRWHRLGLSVAGSFAISALTLAGAAAPAAAAPRMSDVLSQANGSVGVSAGAHSRGAGTHSYRDR